MKQQFFGIPTLSGFPQMPMGEAAPAKPSQRKRTKSEVPKPSEEPKAPPAEEKVLPKVKINAQEKTEFGGFTRKEIQNGFKMSIILGEPLSRKRYGRR